MPPESLSLGDARRIAIRAQGLDAADPRAKPAHSHVRDTLERLGVIQIDSVSAVARAHHIAPFARLGAYDRRHLDDLAYRRGEAFEYWGHEASLLPVASQPLFRWRMAEVERGEGRWEYWSRVQARRADYVAEILARIRGSGAVTAAALNDGAQRSSPWWGWSDAKQALEWLFRSGRLVRVRDARFEIVYEVPERVLPADVLSAPTPSKADAQRALCHKAVRALGVGTVADVADYFRLPVADAKARLAELIHEGSVLATRVESWSQVAFLDPAATPGRRRSRTTFVSPFDSLVWNRARDERLFGFRYQIEIYTPEPKRTYGYYVLPLLHDGRLVGRADVRADRKAGVLWVHGAFAEAGEDPVQVAAAMRAAGLDLARWLALAEVRVGPRGNVAPLLRSEEVPPRVAAGVPNGPLTRQARRRIATRGGALPGRPIATPRLDLVPMSPAFLAATIDERWADAESLLDATVPPDWRTDTALAPLWCERLDKDPDFAPWGPRALVLRAERRMVGHAGFHLPPGAPHLEPYAPGGVEIGYTVFAADRDRGYATEAAAALLAFASSQGVPSCVASISPQNIPSLAVARKLGFLTKVASHVDPDDGPEDVYVRLLVDPEDSDRQRGAARLSG